jgi:hypothetical protein
MRIQLRQDEVLDAVGVGGVANAAPSRIELHAEVGGDRGKWAAVREWPS